MSDLSSPTISLILLFDKFDLNSKAKTILETKTLLHMTNMNVDHIRMFEYFYLLPRVS